MRNKFNIIKIKKKSNSNYLIKEKTEGVQRDANYERKPMRKNLKQKNEIKENNTYMTDTTLASREQAVY